MNNFYEILDLLYKFNKELPEISFGQLIHNLTINKNDIFYMSDEELIKRLNFLIEKIKESK